MKYLYATAALAVVASAQEYCQRGWFRYNVNADSAGYDGAVDFKACEGQKFATSGNYEWGKWYACALDADNSTDMTTYVWERYYDSFKCNDGTKLNETRVGAVGDLNDASWVAQMQAEYPSMFMLFEEDDTYCDALGTVECTIEMNTIYELSTSDASFVCDGVEWYREKSQKPTRRCYYGQVFNCTGDDAFDWTLYANSDCTGSSTTYAMSSGCMNRITGVANQSIVYDTNAQDEVRILKCTAAPLAAAKIVAAAVAMLFAAFSM